MSKPGIDPTSVCAVRALVRSLADAHGHRAVALLLLESAAGQARLTHTRGGQPAALAQAHGAAIDALAKVLKASR